MDKHSFLDGPGLVVYLLVHNVKLVGVHGVSCGGAVKVYGGGGLKMFLDSFPQGSARFLNVRTGTVDVWALVLVDDSCFVGFGVLVLGVSQGCSEGVGALEVDLDTSAFAQSFEFFCCFGDVGDHYGCFVIAAVVWVAAGIVVGVGSW